MKGKHLFSIDMLRGMVALLVCLYHFSEGFLPSDSTFRFVFSRGYLGVEIFFVISGFVIPYAMYKADYQLADAPRFLLKRLLRIEPPYWCSIALIFIIEYVSTFFSPYKDKVIILDWRNILYHVLHLNDLLGKSWLKGIYWSLAVEVQYYMLMALIFPFLVFKNKWVSSAVLLAFCMGRWLEFDHTVLYYGCHFAAGILLFNYHIHKLTEREIRIGLFINFCICFWCFDVYHLCAIVGSSLFILYFNYFVGALVTLGKWSYSFYLIHIQVGWTLLDALVRTYPEGNRIEFIFWSIFCTTIASYFFYTLIEKPSHRWSHHIKLKRNTTSG